MDLARRATPLLLVVLAVAVAVAVASAGCGGAPARRTAEEPVALVIPPLAPADASPPVGVVTTGPVTFEPTTSAFAIPARDPRLLTRRPRSRAQVQSEAMGLERALDAMKESDPRRPSMLRRLADALSEMAASASGPQAVQLRGDAIVRYRALVDGYPQHAQLDEARYYLAFGYEQNGDLANARRSYYEIIAHHPASRLMPLAYFAFGEMFFLEAVTDPTKNELARQAFAEALRYPPADNPVYADALLRQGETELRLKEDAKARRSFELLRRDFPGSEAATKIPLP